MLVHPRQVRFLLARSGLDVVGRPASMARFTLRYDWGTRAAPDAKEILRGKPPCSSCAKPIF